MRQGVGMPKVHLPEQVQPTASMTSDPGQDRPQIPDLAYYSKLSPKTRVLNMARSVFKVPMLERWLKRRVAGKPAKSFWARFLPPEYTYPKGTWRHVTRNGMEYRLDISNVVEYWTYFEFDNPGDEELDALIGKDQTIIDVGAYTGLRSMDFARLAPLGTVIAFEPDPATFAQLTGHIRLNGLDRIKAFNMGIGAEKREEELYRMVDANPGMNRIIRHGEVSGEHGSVRVTITPLLPVLQELGVDRVDLIKVDTEGFDLEVLKGCVEVIERDHPILFVEVDNDNLKGNGATAEGLIAWVRDRGYNVKVAGSNAPLPADLTHCHFDILCQYPAGAGNGQ